MTKESAVTLADVVVAETSRSTPARSSDAMRAAAMIRALADEVDRHHPSDSRIAGLHTQLGDELARLADVVTSATGPDSRAPVGESVADTPIDVLVVDDEADCRNATVLALKSFGYPCRIACSAEEALAEYERQPAAIVVSDWVMPGRSGLDLCVALKQKSPPPYVILATAHADNARLLDGVRRGVDDFLRKPVDLDELELRLTAATRLVRAVRIVARLTERMRNAASAGS